MSGQFDFSGQGGPGTPPSIGGQGAQPAASSFSPTTTAADASFRTPAPVAGAAPRPPVVWIVAGIALAVVAAVSALVFAAQPAVTIVAWFLAGPVAISLLAVYSFRDTGRRANVLYSVDQAVVWLYRTGLVVIYAAIITTALVIAQWAGRL